jgi:uridine kinase
MNNDQAVHEIAGYIHRRKTSHPLSVAVDGIDAAGKTTLADSLEKELRPLGYRVIRASIDGFHNPRAVRYARGNLSPEGYYYDSFDYGALKTYLLLPLLKNGGMEYRRRIFDFTTDAPVESESIHGPGDFILIFEGVFLFRPELLDYWDVKIFVDISFEESLRRALARDGKLFGGSEEIKERYTRRYIPGQKLYLELCQPKALADIVVQNDELANPVLEIISSRDH